MILGWEVETEDAVGYDYVEGATDDASDALRDAMAGIGRTYSDGLDCIWQWSLYDSYPDYLWIGVEIIDKKHAITDENDKKAIDVFCDVVANDADKLHDAAIAVYRAVMGKEPDVPPSVMVIGMEC